jgi:hypothetical protein
MPPTFQPPVVLDVPTTLPDSRGPGARARRFYGPNPRGVNVYVYADGTVTQDNPAHTSAELATDVAPVITYYGGHVYTVSAADAAVLNAAGYTTS